MLRLTRESVGVALVFWLLSEPAAAAVRRIAGWLPSPPSGLHLAFLPAGFTAAVPARVRPSGARGGRSAP